MQPQCPQAMVTQGDTCPWRTIACNPGPLILKAPLRFWRWCQPPKSCVVIAIHCCLIQTEQQVPGSLHRAAATQTADPSENGIAIALQPFPQLPLKLLLSLPF